VLERKQQIFVFLGRDPAVTVVIDAEGNGRCTREYVHHLHSTSDVKANAKVECVSKYETSPSSANLHELTPPIPSDPHPPLGGTGIVEFTTVKSSEPTVREYMEKYIIIEGVDGCTRLTTFSVS
jgi:hypothetical protein